MVAILDNFSTESSVPEAWQAKTLLGYTIQAQDGEAGKLHDFFFNEKNWVIEYLAVDLGNWMLDTGAWIPGTKTVVLVDDFDYLFPEEEIMSLALTKTQVEYSPRIEAEQASMTINPHTRQPIQPAALSLEQLGGGLLESQQLGMHPDSIFETLRSQEQQQRLDPPPESKAKTIQAYSLRNLFDLYIEARDGSMGHVEDFIINTKNWLVEYLIVDTRNWLPGRKVLVPTQVISQVNFDESMIVVDLSQEEIEDSPTFVPVMWGQKN